MGEQCKDTCVSCSSKGYFIRAEFNSQVDKMIHSVDSHSLCPVIPVIDQWVHGQTGQGGRERVYAKAWQLRYPPTNLNLATAAADFQICQHQRRTLSHRYETITWSDQSVIWGRLITLDHFLHGKDGVNTFSAYGFAFLAQNVSAKPPSLDLQNTLSTVMVFIQYWFWTRNSLHSHKSTAICPQSWNPLVLPCSPPPWSRWLGRKMEWPLKDTVRVSIRWQQSGEFSRRQYILFESAFNTKYDFSHIHDSQVQVSRGEKGNSWTHYYP